MAAHFRFGPDGRFELDGAQRLLQRDGVAIALGSRAFEVLLALLEAGGALVTKQQLLDRAWPGLVVEEANVYVTIAQLRKLLGAEVFATVGGLGYRLAVPVAATPVEAAPQHNLPAERTPFVGRQQLLGEAQRLLQQTRLLTLVGIGGSGKTRLALKLAEFALADHRHGVRWVDLAAVAGADHVDAAIALAVGCKLQAAVPPLDALKLHCRSLELLLVLDNCEHLLGGVAQAIDGLLAAAPALRILATSREALGLDGERVLPVRPLELPAAGADLQAIARAEAVRLFVERARSVVPDLALDAASAPAIAELCRRLDGLPLAIELAAARLRLLSVPQLLDLLDQRFLLLTGGARALPRQQTLQAMIRWSYEAAGADAQRAMRAMAACSGCDLAAVTALLGQQGSPAAAIDALTRLVDLGLLAVDPHGHAPRYTMLDTVGQFAQERLGESADAAAVRDRHRSHFLHLAEQWAAQDARPSPRRWLQNLEREHENLLRALAWCDAPGGAVAGLRFVVALRGYWPARGLLRLGHDIATRAVARPGAGDRDALRAEALTALAQLCWWLGEFRSALAWGEEALAIATELHDARLVGWASIGLGYAHGALGEAVQAGRRAEDALQQARSAGDAVLLGDALVAVGDVEFESQRLPRARACYEEAMAVRTQLHMPARQGLAAVGLAEIAIAEQRLDEAAARLGEAAGLALQTGSRYLGNHVVETAGLLAARRQAWALGLRWFHAAARQRETSGMSSATMGERQRLCAIDAAVSALGPTAAADAGKAGAALSCAQSLAEAAAWLGGAGAEPPAAGPAAAPR